MSEPRTFRKLVRSPGGGVLYAVLRRASRIYLVVRWDADEQSKYPWTPLVAFMSEDADVNAQPRGGYAYPGGFARVQLCDAPRDAAIGCAKARAAAETH